MGCLLEFIIEFFVEGFIELIGYTYVKVVSWILPKHKVSDKFYKRFRICVLIVFVIAVLTLMVGIGLLTDGDPYEAMLGRYFTYIPLAIIGSQFLLGILARIIRVVMDKRKKVDEN